MGITKAQAQSDNLAWRLLLNLFALCVLCGERGCEMQKRLLIISVLFLAACASSFNMPVAERSRTYQADSEEVWESAISAVDDVGLALTETEPDHGRIRARRGGNIWDLKGYMLLIVVRDLGGGRVQVDANAETVSEDRVVDFGKSKSIMREYLEALDTRMRTSSGDSDHSAATNRR